MCRCILLLIPLLLAGGCLCDPERVRYPNLFQPGHLSEQQEYSRRFDPFASPEIGPKIVGDRPSGALDPTPANQRRAKEN
jgi:hypothetical protein